MICKKCNEKNLYKAHYCQKCGTVFTEEDREKAYSKTIFGFVNKLEDLFSMLTLDKITGNIYFKIVSILFVLVIGVYNVMSNGNVFKILESEQYRVQYNTKTDEYYLISSESIFNVSLYLPKEVHLIYVSELDDANAMIEKVEYTLNDEIVLEQTNHRYEIEVVYHNQSSEKVVIRVFGK